jgi:tetratricopeptide (TPR) repeat protein
MIPEVLMLRLCRYGLFVAVLIASSLLALAQTETDKRAQAIQASEKIKAIDITYADAMNLYDQNRHFEALPVLEKLLEKYPTDAVIMERLGSTLIMTSVAAGDADARKQLRARGRQLLARAKELGLTGNIDEYYLSSIPEDGGPDAVFSSHKEANEAMQEGEKAFARRDYGSAIKAYTQAMLLDPTLYSAVLFIGDSYFADRKNEDACEWFQRATKVDPNKEVAYRYWGDALMRQGKMDEAQSKFIEAIIAEPYVRQPWVGLKQWADANHIQAAHPDIKAPKGPQTTAKADGSANITLNADVFAAVNKNDGTGAWGIYQIIAGAWQAKVFKEKYPDEKQYRHSLAEESAALGAAADSVKKDLEKGKLKTENLDSGIAALLKLSKAEMLQPFILLSRPDAGIAQDYEAYREKNRDKLRQYLRDFVVPKDRKP